MWPPLSPIFLFLVSCVYVPHGMNGVGVERGLHLDKCFHLEEEEVKPFPLLILIFYQVLLIYRAAHICRSYLCLGGVGSRLPDIQLFLVQVMCTLSCAPLIQLQARGRLFHPSLAPTSSECPTCSL